MKIIQSSKIEELENQFLIPKGWIQSWYTNTSVDGNNAYLPWYNYAIISFLQERISNTMQIFEFGCGYSSIFYGTMAQNVRSIESNITWVNKIQALALSLNLTNIDIVHQEDITNIDIKEQYDVVIVDSQQRNQCISISLSLIKECGVIILDNSERTQYQKSYLLLQEHGFRYINFTGIGPLRCKESQTTIFYRDNNVFNI